MKKSLLNIVPRTWGEAAWAAWSFALWCAAWSLLPDVQPSWRRIAVGLLFGWSYVSWRGRESVQGED